MTYIQTSGNILRHTILYKFKNPKSEHRRYSRCCELNYECRFDAFPLGYDARPETKHEIQVLKRYCVDSRPIKIRKKNRFAAEEVTGQVYECSPHVHSVKIFRTYVPILIHLKIKITYSSVPNRLVVMFLFKNVQS